MPRSSRAPVSLQAVKSIAQVVPAVADRLVYSIRLADIEPSDHNPRHHMDGIDELADSLRAHGLLQPIVVRRRDGGYVLIAGHRRYEAARSSAGARSRRSCARRRTIRRTS